jgi:alpha-glucuronidase
MAMSDQLFSDLLLDLGPYLGADWKVGTPWGPDNDPKTAAAHALMASVLKKHLASDRTSDAQNAVAVEKFHKSNEKCGTWVFNPLTSLDEELLGEFKYTLYKFFYPQGQNLLFHINDLFDRGAVDRELVSGGEERTSIRSFSTRLLLVRQRHLQSHIVTRPRATGEPHGPRRSLSAKAFTAIPSS